VGGKHKYRKQEQSKGKAVVLYTRNAGMRMRVGWEEGCMERWKDAKARRLSERKELISACPFLTKTQQRPEETSLPRKRELGVLTGRILFSWMGRSRVCT